MIVLEPTRAQRESLVRALTRAGIERADDAIALEVCPDATCGCHDIIARLGGPGSRRALYLDPVDRRCYAAEPDRFGDARLERAAEELGPDDWDWLYRRFLSAKEQAFASFDPDSAAVELPFEEVEHEGLMLAFADIFPFHPIRVFEGGPERYVVLDQYCLRARCSCTDVAVSLHRARAGEGHGRQCGAAREAYAFMVDYSSGVWRTPRGRPRLGREAEAMANRLRADWPTLLADLRSRHELLRRVYAASARAAGVIVRRALDREPARALARVGRNDPCPCGSGKKHKKCCGK